MTDLSLKLLANILDANRRISIGNDIFICFNHEAAYVAWSNRGFGVEIVRPTIPELAARMEEMGWLK